MEVMCLHTSSNTGNKIRACFFVNKTCAGYLLHLACRHHIIELIAGVAFKRAITTTSVPQVLLFINVSRSGIA